MTHACHTAGASTRTTPNRWDSSWPVFVTEPRRRTILGYFEDRFGIPLSAFDAYHVLERRHGYVVLPKSARVETIASFKVQNVGLPILRKMPHHLKPTTAALQRFGKFATRHVVDLAPAEMIGLLREQEIRVEMELQPGYVLLRCEGRLLGCGIYTPGRLRSLIPLRQVKHQHLPESAPGIEARPRGRAGDHRNHEPKRNGG